MLIIGFAGYSKAGKDEAARGLPPFFKRAAFADALKVDVARTFEVTLEELERDKETYRPELIAHGCACRARDPLHWIKRIRLPESESIAITDVRYREEAEFIQSLGGKVIYILRPDYDPAHPEERRSIADLLSAGIINGVIINDGTIEELHERACRLGCSPKAAAS